MSERLRLDPAIDRPDDFYEALVEMHRGLTPEESARANARLVLVLANQIGDLEVLKAALRVARDAVGGEAPR